MSERILGIAADVLRSFGSAFGGRHLAIVGGAVPGLIVLEPPEGLLPHVGTADLDLHLSLNLLDGETADYYEAIIDGLRDLGLRPGAADGRERKWQWVGQYRDTRLQVELLCPVRTGAARPEGPAPDSPAEANIGPTGQITALAIGYGHLVPPDTVAITRRVRAESGMLDFEFPVAGLASWMCLKSDAIMRRNKFKDAYDVVWVIDALGPAEVAAKVSESPLLSGEYADEVVAQLCRLTDDQFRDGDSVGPNAYERFLKMSSQESLRQHALGSIGAFREELRSAGVTP